MIDTAVRLARLGAALRAEAVPTSLRDELDAASALALLDQEDRQEVRAALLIALKVPREHFETLDRLLGVFWGEQAPPRAARPRAPQRETRGGGGRLLHWDPDTRRIGEGSAAAPESGDEPGYSPEAVLRRKRFDETSWSPRDLAFAERLLRRLARRLASRPSRRLVPAHRGRADLRSSYRRALRTQGEPITLARRARAVERARLVFLLDTSGSMDTCSRFLLAFVLALRRAAPRAFAFAFNTELVDVTRSLAPGKLRLTLERLSAAVPDWSGGTRIGESLAAFVRDHLRRTVDAKTVVVVLSDGLDRGDPALLARALRTIRQRAAKLIWLNPLVGDPRYRPEARGMQAALPYVDHLAAAHDLASLERALPRLAI